MDAAFGKTRLFLRKLGESIEPSPNTLGYSLRFWQEEEGSLALNKSEAEQYRRCLGSLVAAVADAEQVSAKAVERALQSAMFAVVDIPKKRATELEVRIDEALRELRRYLSSPPRTFQVFIRVNGLAAEGLPTTVGKVEFAVFDADQLERFRDAVSRHKVTEEERALRLEQVEELSREEELYGRTVGIVEVKAIEWGGAKSLALRELRQTLDVINFYTDLVPYTDAHLSLPGDGGRARVTIPQLRLEEGSLASYWIGHQWIGSRGEFSLQKLRDFDAQKNLGFAHATHLLGRERTKLEDQVIASLQWAGRATVDRRKEEAFLLYAIALESFILAEGDNQELSYRLRLRVAHLLEESAAARRDVFAKVKDLYEIRSKIVHSGKYQVTDANLGLMRAIAKQALIRACTSEEFIRMTSKDNLRDWFDERLLR